MLWLGRSDVERGIGVCVWGVLASYCLAFFGGLCDGARGGGLKLSWVWVRVCGLLRVFVVCEGESCFGLVVGASCVCLLRRVRRVRWVLWVGLVRLCMRSVTSVSSSPVITYLRWDRESDSACYWVCARVGMRPWYMVVRLVRSMCMPYVHPSVC